MLVNQFCIFSPNGKNKSTQKWSFFLFLFYLLYVYICVSTFFPNVNIFYSVSLWNLLCFRIAIENINADMKHPIFLDTNYWEKFALYKSKYVIATIIFFYLLIFLDELQFKKMLTLRIFKIIILSKIRKSKNRVRTVKKFRDEIDPISKDAIAGIYIITIDNRRTN